MVTHEQAATWGNFWQIIDLSKKLLSDYEELQTDSKFAKRFPHIDTAYIDSIIVHIAKIFSDSRNEPFRLGNFKEVCRSEIKSEFENVEKEYRDIIGKIVTNRNKLIAHLDKNFYDLCFSENEIARMERNMAKAMRIDLLEAKNIYASMPRTMDKSKERYSIGDFRDDFSTIKEMIEKLDEIWGRSIPFAS